MAENPLRPTVQNTNLPPSSLLGSLQGEVSTEATPILQFVLDNVRAIAGIIVLLVLMVIVAGGWRWHAKNTQQTAQNELGMILVTKQGPDRIAALQTFAAKAPASVRSAAYLELAATAMLLRDYGKAAEAYAKIEGETGLGIVSTVSEASALIESGKPAEALVLLEKIEPTAPEGVRNFIRSHLAVAAEAAGDYQKALSACENILATGNAPEADYLRFKVQELKARIAAKA